MRDYAQLHDETLDYERDIEIDVEMLSKKRMQMYREKDIDILKEIVPVLNTLIHDAERYKEWILKQN